MLTETFAFGADLFAFHASIVIHPGDKYSIFNSLHFVIEIVIKRLIYN